ncbi:hypothetical protein MXD60_03925 [Frankia sp. AgB32]|nr:hypothetical protein [Frankia sp. AgB32]MCK9893748.1 hypothetical protein [Frankia sp. AgB32]
MANIGEIAYTSTYSSWLNRLEAQFTALRSFALDGTAHRAQASVIRRYVVWRNQHAHDKDLRAVVARAIIACRGTRVQSY